MHTNPAKNVGFSSTTNPGAITRTVGSVHTVVKSQHQMRRRIMSKYIYNLPCSECEQVIPHTFNQDFEYAECTCPHCKAESFVLFDEGEQEALYDYYINNNPSTRDI
jgi:hypothetical protein